jgi:hypothetical protein
MVANSRPLRINSVSAALAVSIGLILVLALLLAWERRLAPVAILTVFGTSIWAAIDSFRIELQAYRTRIAFHPMVLFNLMYLFWVPLFPWYLVVRARIIAGTLPRKALASSNVPAKPQQSVISSRRRWL